MCIKVYELDPAHFSTQLRLAWQACLIKTKVKLELLADADMLLMVEGIMGGISHAIHRYAKENSPYMGKNLDKTELIKYLMYLNANNPYGYSMSEPLPVGGFNWKKYI